MLLFRELKNVISSSAPNAANDAYHPGTAWGRELTNGETITVSYRNQLSLTFMNCILFGSFLPSQKRSAIDIGEIVRPERSGFGERVTKTEWTGRGELVETSGRLLQYLGVDREW